MLHNIKVVLVVDDAPEYRLLFSILLRKYEVIVLTAEDGREAMERLEDEPIDLMITDFRMPFVNGVDLLRWCRARKLHIPIIFSTAEGCLFQSEEIALGDCCATLLRKPVDVKVLHEAMVAADRMDHHAGCLHAPTNKAIDTSLEIGIGAT